MAKGFTVSGKTPEVSKMNNMESFGYIVLAIFIIIRVLIAAGVLYLIIIEFRRYSKKHPMNKSSESEGDKDANRKGIRRHAGESSSS
jgi:hypothetical protein